MCALVTGVQTCALPIYRPDQARLVDADAETRTGRLIEAEIGECLTQIEIRLAGADDAARATFAIDDDAVDAVGARECGRRRQAPIDELVFFDQRRMALLQRSEEHTSELQSLMSLSY